MLPSVSRGKLPFLISHPIDHFLLLVNFSVGHVDSKIIPESVKRHMIQSLSHKNKGGKKGKSFSFLSFPFSDSLSFPVLFFSRVLHSSEGFICL